MSFYLTKKGCFFAVCVCVYVHGVVCVFLTTNVRPFATWQYYWRSLHWSFSQSFLFLDGCHTDFKQEISWIFKSRFLRFENSINFLFEICVVGWVYFLHTSHRVHAKSARKMQVVFYCFLYCVFHINDNKFVGYSVTDNFLASHSI